MTVCVNNTRHSLWQDPLWKRFQESIGRKAWCIESGGAHAIVIKHTLPLGLSWLEVPRGPLVENAGAVPDMLEELKKLANSEGAIFIRLSPYHHIDAGKPTNLDHHPETSLIIDLEKSEDEILAQMKQKGRYNIKVAKKHGVTVEASQNIDEFYGILKKTTNRDGFAAHPKSYYKKMLDSLGKNAQLLIAKHKNKAIAGGIFVYLNDFGIYYYGASDYDQRNLMAPYLIQWHAIKEAKNRGCKKYDFLGIAPEGAKNHPWAGVTSFKKKFGGTVVSYPRAREVVIRPFWNSLYKIYKKF